MTRRSLTAFIVCGVLAGALLAVLFWHPWDRCRAPEQICAALSEVKTLDGITQAEVEYEVTDADALGLSQATVRWTLHLDDQLSAHAAGQLAERGIATVSNAVVEQVELTPTFRLVSGEPEASDVPDLFLYPLDISALEEPAAQLEEAYTLWQAGAAKVATGMVTADDRAKLVQLAELCADRGYVPTLVLGDESVRYTPTRAVDLDQVNLTVEASEQPGVQSSIFDTSGLSVHTESPDVSAQTQQVQNWLDAHKPLPEATAYTLSSPGYANIIQGWIGGQLPDSQIPQPPTLPDSVTPWETDPQAPACAADDLELSLGTPEAATGRRYLAVFASNNSSRSCALEGYPQVRFLNAAGDEQTDIKLQPAPTLLAVRVVVPAGETALTTLTWSAMSTSQDPDETVTLEVAAAADQPFTTLEPRVDGHPASLDVLDGAEVTLNPWVQALEGWTMPDSD